MSVKDDRGGIGMESEKKRKMREELEERNRGEKRRKAEEGEFVERVRREGEERRVLGLLDGAMKVAERLAEEEVEQDKGETEKEAQTETGREPRIDLKRTNVLWRSLVKRRLESENEAYLRRSYAERFSRDELPGVADREEDTDDKLALGTGTDEDLNDHADDEDEEGDDDRDAELDEFEALAPAERLRRLVEYLRSTYRYCFWCKYRYPDVEMEGCPGVTEEEHD